jgi:hypothetical protein
MLCLETGQINFKKKMFAVSSYRSVGCTFFDWSIHYLSGQKNFYSIKNCDWGNLSSNPVTKINAHGHLKNHPRGLNSTKKCIEHLKTVPAITSFYPTPLTLPEAAHSTGITLDGNTTQQDFQKIFSKQKQDFVDTIHYIADQHIDLIYVDTAPESVLYFIENRSREGTVTKIPNGQTVYSLEQIQKDHQELFFKDSLDTWSGQALTEKWDERERLALCSRPFEFDAPDIALQTPHLKIDSRSLWVNGEHCVKKSLTHLGLSLDESRWDHWIKIYKQWQQPQIQNLEFVFNYHNIVNAIINDLWLEIDLTFEQEVVIQHCLIYHHNLNLKTWKLEKFPNNTRLLHQLLEPNIHPIVK